MADSVDREGVVNIVLGLSAIDCTGHVYATTRTGHDSIPMVQMTNLRHRSLGV